MKQINKRGAEMTVGTLVIIVLAIVVLVVLVLGFTGGWSNLWNRVTNLFGSSNVGSIVQACQVACTAGNQYDFCTLQRKVVFEDKKSELMSCKVLASKGVGLGLCSEFTCPKVKSFSTEAEAKADCKTFCDTLPTNTDVAVKDAICNQDVSYTNAQGESVTTQCRTLDVCKGATKCG